MEGVLILHEALNLIRVKKQSAMLFKVDFKKSQDKIKWSFVYQMMQIKGFHDRWGDWLMKLASGGFVSVNDSHFQETSYKQNGNGFGGTYKSVCATEIFLWRIEKYAPQKYWNYVVHENKRRHTILAFCEAYSVQKITENYTNFKK